MNFKNLDKLSGDASLRKFYRNKKNKSIVIYCRKDKFKNLIVYDAINKLLNKNKINAPFLINENYKKNYIEISDLGNISGLSQIKKLETKSYNKLFEILTKLRNIKQKKIKTKLNNIYTIPDYSDHLLMKELKLFSEWYIPKIIKKKSKKLL